MDKWIDYRTYRIHTWDQLPELALKVGLEFLESSYNDHILHKMLKA